MNRRTETVNLTAITACGICDAFPCEQQPSVIHWNPDIVEHLSALAQEVSGTAK